MEKINVCSACNGGIPGREDCLRCTVENCKKTYHLLCAGGKSPGIELMATWICPECRCASKKGGDNSLTPVGASKKVRDQYVTLRKKDTQSSGVKETLTRAQLITDSPSPPRARVSQQALPGQSGALDMAVEIRDLRQEIGALRGHLDQAVTAITTYDTRLEQYDIKLSSYECALGNYETKLASYASQIEALHGKLAIYESSNLNSLDAASQPQAQPLTARVTKHQPKLKGRLVEKGTGTKQAHPELPLPLTPKPTRQRISTDAVHLLEVASYAAETTRGCQQDSEWTEDLVRELKNENKKIKKDEPASSGDSGDESGSEPESPSEKLMQIHKQEWANHEANEAIKREAFQEPQASTSSITQEADSSKGQPGLAKILPKIPGGAMLYPAGVLGLDGIGSNMGLGSLAMSYPHSFILGLANQGQEGASSSTQPQFITIPLSMANMAMAGASSANGCSSDDSSELQDLSTGRK